MLAKIDGRFSDLDAKQQRAFADAAREVARLKDDVEAVQRDGRVRFSALAEEYANGTLRTSLPSIQHARDMGRMVKAVIEDDRTTIAGFQGASMGPQTGTDGGYLMPHQYVPGLIRNVEQYGVAERNIQIVPAIEQNGSQAKRTQGPTIGYPDLGVQPSEGQIKTGKISFNLTRYSVYLLIDRWMMTSGLEVALGEFVNRELGWALALAQDQNVFIGDGTSTYAKVTGIFKRANSTQLTVTADSGHETFQDILDASVKYPSAAAGLLPEWADVSEGDGANAFGPKFYLHRTLFWGFLGARDSQLRPVADILTSTGKPQRFLNGYPAEIVQVAPKLSQTGVSTVMMVLGNLFASHRLYRHMNKIELRASEHVRFLEGQLCIILDAMQDIVEADDQGYVQIKTAAS